MAFVTLSDGKKNGIFGFCVEMSSFFAKISARITYLVNIMGVLRVHCRMMFFGLCLVKTKMRKNSTFYQKLKTC